MEQKIRRDRNMGSNLRRLRDQYGISQEKLCAELQRRGCDIGRTAYAKYESGELNIKASVIMGRLKIAQRNRQGTTRTLSRVHASIRLLTATNSQSFRM